MTFLLDTDICSFAMKRRFAGLEERLLQFDSGELKVSAATEYELQVGALKRGNSDHLQRVIGKFLSLVEVLDFDRDAARNAAAVRARLEQAGRPLGAMDMLIAGHALSIGATLVTNSVREFSRVEGLTVENWAG
ncbi:MAG: PIN domain-containing protein [Acidobacteriota bacterium]